MDSANDSKTIAPKDNSVASLDESVTTIGAVDDSELTVDTSDQKPTGNFCFYCKKMQSVISRHLALLHKDECDVKKFLDLPKKTLERRQIIETIRLRGNNLCSKNHEFNKGKLLVCRRPNKNFNKTAADYTACHNCLGRYSKKSIRHHRRRCLNKVSDGTRTNTILSRRVEGRLHESANAQLRNVVFPVLREDDVV